MNLPWTLTTFDRLIARLANLPHAMLLTGPAGIGKSALAVRVANALLCESPLANGDACGQCLACGWLAQGSHPDLRRLEPIDEEAAERAGKGVKASKDIRIQQVRDLAGFVGLGTHRGGRRIVVVDPADALNNEAANALLKTLEEPSEHSHFVVVAERWQALPATIVSRCVRFDVVGPTPTQALDWLRDEAGVAAEVAEACLAAAGGSPLSARRLAEADQGAVHRLILETVARLPETAMAASADVLAAQPTAYWVDILQSWVSDLGRSRLGAEPYRFIAQRARLQRLARQVIPARLGEFAGWLDHQRGIAEHPLNARLFCESILMRYQQIFRPEGR